MAKTQNWKLEMGCVSGSATDLLFEKPLTLSTLVSSSVNHSDNRQNVGLQFIESFEAFGAPCRIARLGITDRITFLQTIVFLDLSSSVFHQNATVITLP